MKLILFDCDGTIVDSAGIIHTCMQKTFREAGLSAPDFAQTKSIIGLTLDVAIAQMLERAIDERIHQMVARYKHHNVTMRAQQTVHEPFFDGVESLLDVLAGKDEILVGIVTGKSRRGLNALLEKHAFGRSVVTSRTADECPSKPHPAMVLECCDEAGVDPIQTVVVGDAIYDMQMARSAGALAIGVSWGYSTTAALQDAGAHHVVDHPHAVLPLIAAENEKGASHA